MQCQQNVEIIVESSISLNMNCIEIVSEAIINDRIST